MADILGQAQGIRSQRKRKRVSYSCDGVTTSPSEDKGQESLLSLASNCSKLVIFSGSGLSAGSGMSTFSTKGGLYERAQKRFNVTNGKRLFTYNFYEKRKLEALAFFADIYAEARKAKPSLGHKALAQIAGAHKLLRHYTMNIDGLAESAGMDTWHVDNNPTGLTVEMHGNINQLVCPSCGVVVMMTPALLRKLRSKKAIPCTKCDCQAVRCRIMLYDDGEDDVITPEDVFDIMEEDVQQADLVLWVGISFEQSASTAYFRRVRQYLMEGRRQDLTRQAVINITEDAVWNLMSACSNTGSMDVLEVLGSSDVILPMLAAAMTVPTRSAPVSAAQTDPLQPSLQQQPTCQNGLPAESAKGSRSAAVREEDQAHQQSTVSAAAARVQPQADGRTQGKYQLQHEPTNPSRAGQAQEGPDESCGQSHTAPSAQTTLQSQHGHEAGTSHIASAKPGETSHGEGSQEETPVWLQSVAPVPNAEQMLPPKSLRQANTCYLQQQQWQEQQHNHSHTMQFGLAQTTMRPPCLAEAHLQQGFGQIIAPLDQQQLTQKLPPNSDVAFDNSESRPSITGVAAPVYVKQAEGEEVGRSSAVSQSGASQQRNDGQDSACHAHQAVAATHELDQTHDQSESWPPLLTASSTGQATGVSVLEHPQRAQQAQHAQHAQQAQHVQVAQHPQQAQHAQQTQHAPGLEPLNHPASEADQADTCEQSDQTQQAADQPQCCGVVQDQHPPVSWQGIGHAVAGHSGIVPGESVVSSREHAQRHLLNAAPLPWQHPENQCIAEPSEQQN